MSDFKGIINILIIINIRWALELSHNLLHTIFLAKKDIKIFWRNIGQISKIVIDDEVFGLADIIENQYIIWLAEDLKPAIVKWVATLIIETLYAWMGYLEYRSLI